jgi:hypothetical protein
MVSNLSILPSIYLFIHSFIYACIETTDYANSSLILKSLFIEKKREKNIVLEHWLLMKRMREEDGDDKDDDEGGDGEIGVGEVHALDRALKRNIKLRADHSMLLYYIHCSDDLLTEDIFRRRAIQLFGVGD